MDECLEDKHDCHADAKCTNSPGSWFCACNPGYHGDGVSCVDNNECVREDYIGWLRHNCHVDGVCTNNPGSFDCACQPGFTGDGVDCAGKLSDKKSLNFKTAI